MMRRLAENLVRAAMNNVDIWRSISALEEKGWNEPAIADALAQPVRTIQATEATGPMLEVMAEGLTPSDDQLRTIAAAGHDEQVQVWKKYKPKKGYDLAWHEVARALAKRRMPFPAAKFDEKLAQAYCIGHNSARGRATSTHAQGLHGATRSRRL
jgi:ParB family transcriptional regulator, chromosome partitioning protein